MRFAFHPVLKGMLLVSACACPILSHMALANGQAGQLVAFWASVQIIVAGVILPWGTRTTRGLVLAFGAVALAVSFYSARSALVTTSGLSHAALYLALLTWFGLSLSSPTGAIVTRIARTIRGDLTPELVGYTRRVTMGWCAFFLAQLSLSAGLFVLAPAATWSLFVNILDLPLVILMFGAEYAYRICKFRHHRHATFKETILAFTKQEAWRGEHAGR